MNHQRVKHKASDVRNGRLPLCALGGTQDSLHATESETRRLSSNGFHWLRYPNLWAWLFLLLWLDPHSSDETSLSVYWIYTEVDSVLQAFPS